MYMCVALSSIHTHMNAEVNIHWAVYCDNNQDQIYIITTTEEKMV